MYINVGHFAFILPFCVLPSGSSGGNPFSCHGSSLAEHLMAPKISGFLLALPLVPSTETSKAPLGMQLPFQTDLLLHMFIRVIDYYRFPHKTQPTNSTCKMFISSEWHQFIHNLGSKDQTNLWRRTGYGAIQMATLRPVVPALIIRLHPFIKDQHIKSVRGGSPRSNRSIIIS